MTAPYWQIGPEPWELLPLRAKHPPVKRTPTIYRTVIPSPELVERATVEGGAILNLTFAIFNRWQLIDNSIEGRYLERLSPGVIRKSIRESLRSIRAVLSHGKDPSLGMTVLGTIESIDETADSATARVALFPSVPQLLVDGLEAGVYGASFRGEAIKNAVEYRPERSDYNPQELALAREAAPYWQLGDLRADPVPGWQLLNRRERRDYSHAK